MKKNSIMFFTGISIFLIFVNVEIIQPSRGQSTQDFLVVNDIKCEPGEHFTQHTHTQLKIFIKNGTEYTIPGFLGIIPEMRCIFWIHTHDNSGIIHIESPMISNFTLGQFLSIWNYTQPIDNHGILAKILMETMKNNTNVFVNENKIDATKFKEIILNDKDTIIISEGQLPHNISLYYKPEK